MPLITISERRVAFPGGTGCYSATSPSPLTRNRDPGCYIGCYKVLHRVLHFEVQGLKSNECAKGMTKKAMRKRMEMDAGDKQVIDR
jgi:hypothetical protein